MESVPHVQAARVDLAESCIIVEHAGADREVVNAALREEGFEPQND